ncbi:MFS transporter [Ruminococcus sp. OA3]|uniref:MFS transporter n=1 Tax=Ruminococcus sp. OA3 TaxID=2914164 RepID=UPI001F054100|nr:MFS transporter [Ruminococcus sp. OA3]MCH1984343.1 MFS transporter [Ruminococcus sp. OA3]
MEQLKWKQKFITVAFGQTVSLVGSSAVQFALIWWIASETQSPLMLGMSGMVAYLPVILLSPLAGVLADRVNRKLICITADMFIGLAAAVFAVIMWKYELPVWSALIVLLVRGIGSTFHQPSIQAIIPQIVPPQELVRANGWSQFMQSGAFMLGPVIGAALYAAFPLPVVLLSDLAGAAAASGLLAVVRIPEMPKEHERTHKKFLREFKEGIDVFFEDRKLLVLIIAETVCMVFFLPLASFYPLMTSSYFRGSAWHASAVELSFAVGMMAAAVLFGSVFKVKNKIRMSYIGLLGIGISSAACGVLPPAMQFFWVFVVSCGFMGAFGNIHTIPFMAYMQENIDPLKMGRAFSVVGIVSSLAMPVGLLIGGPVAEKIGVNMWFLVTGLICIIVTAVSIGIERRQ